MDGPKVEAVPRPFLPDRLFAALLAFCQLGSVAYYLWSYWTIWSADQSRSRSMLFDWMSDNHYWNGLAEAVLYAALFLWVAAGVLRNKGWAFLILAFHSARYLLAYLGYPSEIPIGSKIILGIYLLLFLYAGLRTTATLGPRPASPLGRHDGGNPTDDQNDVRA